MVKIKDIQVEGTEVEEVVTVAAVAIIMAMTADSVVMEDILGVGETVGEEEGMCAACFLIKCTTRKIVCASLDIFPCDGLSQNLISILLSK